MHAVEEQPVIERNKLLTIVVHLSLVFTVKAL